jgi:O-antigen/teichoic acid export membrane protein
MSQMTERDDWTEIPLERSGHRWRFVTGGVLGFFAVFLLVSVAFSSGERPHAGESDAYALAMALLFFAPLSLSFLVSAVGIYRGWSSWLFLKTLPFAVLACLFAALIWADCA